MSGVGNPVDFTAKAPGKSTTHGTSQSWQGPRENVQRNKKIQFGVFHPEKMHFHTSVLHFRHYPQERWGNRVAALQKPSDHDRKGKFMRKSSSQGSETSAAA